MNEGREMPVVEIIDQEVDIGLDDLCRACRVSSEELLEWIAEGVAEPRGQEVQEWRFSVRQFRRVRTASRLQRDLGVDTASLPLVLDLLEEVNSLRDRLRSLERFLDE